MIDVAMHLKQFYLGCLAHASYLVGSDGEAAVVDPRRDVDEYVAEAEAHGFRIRYVLETHLHADFVSGHRELAARTGAEIVLGAKAGAAFPHRAVKDGDVLRLGSLELRVLETPGHTPESVTIVVVEGGVPRAAFTGDTLFIGDVGRPDLAAGAEVTPQDMAGMLYDSLHRKLLALPDDVLVYPAHGAGSLCGRNMSKETFSTLGEQRLKNYALQPMDKARFVEMMTTDLPERPRYFSHDVEMNRSGALPIEALRDAAALEPEAFAARQAQGALVVDVRSAAAFGAGHLPGALHVGLRGEFATWCGTLLDPAREILLVTEDAEQVKEAVTRLARVGLENVAGHLAGGIAAWDRAGRPLEALAQMPVDELRAQIAEARPGLQVVDVRRSGEFASGHVPGAVHLPLDRLETALSGLDAKKPTVAICAGGYRSSIGAALLRRAGFTDVYNVVGGTSAWLAAGYPTA
jgi:glyoxylase-like metal-dependent hydrolase (beta-lactamase superfamily II)/rhodanese-related sulfurtransferase